MAVNENRNKKVMFEHMTCLTKSSRWLKILQIAQKLCQTSIVGLINNNHEKVQFLSRIFLFQIGGDSLFRPGNSGLVGKIERDVLVKAKRQINLFKGNSKKLKSEIWWVILLFSFLISFTFFLLDNSFKAQASIANTLAIYLLIFNLQSYKKKVGLMMVVGGGGNTLFLGIKLVPQVFQ